MNNKIEIATGKFLSGFNCAQSVLYPFSDEIGIDKNIALKAACGFGAGMGRKQEVCGAVTGGIITIGAKYGRGENDDASATDKTYVKTRELMDKFQTKHGTFMCLELLHGCNLTTEKGQKYFKEKDLKNKICMGCVGDVVQILEEILVD
jgi:C_GCAxxG_C_C family probable redox protein